MSDHYHIENVGPITELDIELQPGVNVLRGRNGKGKTTATWAITRAAGGDESRLSVRDGADEGLVEGPGVTLRIGKRITSRGEAAVELESYGTLDALIDPRVKDPQARAKRELEALLEFLGITVGVEEIHQLASGEEQVTASVQGLVVRSKGQVPVLQAIQSVRSTAHQLARDSEKRLEKEEARLGAQREALMDLGWGDGPPDFSEYPTEDAEALREASQLAAVKAARVRQAAESRLELLERQREIRESMMDEPDIKGARQAEEKALAEVERLKAELKVAVGRVGELSSRRWEVEEAHGQWKAQQEILDRDADGPTMEDAADAESRAEIASERYDLGKEMERVEAVWQRFKEQQDLVHDRESEVKHFRAVAGGVAAQTRKLLEDKGGVPGLLIDPEDGLTYAGEETEGIIRKWADLSTGQRTRIALEIAAKRCESQGWARVLPLDPGYWMSLQTERRKEIAGIAKEFGLEILTEEPSDEDELTVEHVG